jgi:hypothetical protein
MSSAAFQRFIERFDRVARSGDQWLVRCPAHDDRKASLSVTEGADGRVLLKCFAGCTTDAIVAALGVTVGDLFEGELPQRREVALYDYRDATGALVYQVVRFEPKDFRQRRPDGRGGWFWNLHGIDRVLYRWPDLAGCEQVVVVEGEKDADRLWAIGIPATTNVGGAGKWRDVYSAQLLEAGVRRLAILPDHDEPGRQHAAAVAVSAQAAGLKVLIIELPGVPVKGDVSDYLAVHGAEALRELVAPQVEADPWLDATAQVAARRAEVVEAVEGRRLTLGLPAIDAVINGIRRGEVLGLMARPGTGKTVMLVHTTHEVAQTTTLGHVFFSLEMPASQIVGRLQQRLYGMTRDGLERADYYGELSHTRYTETFRSLVIVDRGGLSVADMDRMVERICEGPLKGTTLGLISIDHLGMIGGDRKMTTYDRVSVQAREIKELAKRYQCAVLLAVQPNRDSGGDGSRELGLGAARDSGVVEEAMDYIVGMRRLDRSLTLSPAERERFIGAIFAKVIKNRHGDPGVKETAYRLGLGLRPIEDPHLAADEQDVVERIAQQSRGGWRR